MSCPEEHRLERARNRVHQALLKALVDKGATPGELASLAFEEAEDQFHASGLPISLELMRAITRNNLRVCRLAQSQF